MSAHESLSTSLAGRVAAPAFAATGLMWAFGYAALLGPGEGVGAILFAGMIAAALGGGAAGALLGAGGRGGAVKGGAQVGVAIGAINLLVVGMVAARVPEYPLWATFAMWSVGMIAAGVVLGVIGASVVPQHLRGSREWMDPTALFATVSAALVFGMLVTGGIVTGEESGLAVPDWPNSFGHNMVLLPLASMQAENGVLYEHAHRLAGMLVGLTAIALVVQAFRSKQPGAVKGLVILALLLIVAQGILGGLRVTGHLTLSQDRAELDPSTALAIVHGVNGQIVFALFCVIALLTSRAWRSVDASTRAASTMRLPLPVVGLAVVLVQITLGACYRHIQIVNAETGVPTGVKWALHAHLTFALFTIIAMVIVGIKGMRDGAGIGAVRKTGMSLHALLLVQIVLGTLALVAVMVRKSAAIPEWETAVTTAHQVVGAAVLAAMALSVAWAKHLTPRSEARATA